MIEKTEVVGALIRNQQDEFLLQQRDQYAPSFQYHWTLFGGKVEAGESPEEALRRELTEEIELDQPHISSLRLVQTNINDSGVIQYIFEVTTDVRIEDLTLHEGQAMAFIAMNALFQHDRMFAFNIKEVLERYLRESDRKT